MNFLVFFWPNTIHKKKKIYSEDFQTTIAHVFCFVLSNLAHSHSEPRLANSVPRLNVFKTQHVQTVAANGRDLRIILKTLESHFGFCFLSTVLLFKGHVQQRDSHDSLRIFYSKLQNIIPFVVSTSDRVCSFLFTT